MHVVLRRPDDPGGPTKGRELHEIIAGRVTATTIAVVDALIDAGRLLVVADFADVNAIIVTGRIFDAAPIAVVDAVFVVGRRIVGVAMPVLAIDDLRSVGNGRHARVEKEGAARHQEARQDHAWKARTHHLFTTAAEREAF